MNMPHVSSSGGSGGGNSGGGGGTTGGGARGASGSQQQNDNGPGSAGAGGSTANNGPGSNSGASGNGGDDLGSTDEVKVFKDEGDGEDEKLSSSEILTEEKSSLIDLTESEEKSGGGYISHKHSSRSDHCHVFGKVEPNSHPSSFNVGYLVGPYGYANGASGPIPVSMAGKMGLGPGVSAGHAAAAAEAAARLSFFCHNGGSPGPGGGDPLLAAVTAGHHHHHHHQPPPAHMGIPPYQLVDTKAGLTRPPMYPFGTGQYPYPMLSPEMSQVAASWHNPSMYPSLSAAATSASAAAAAAAAAAAGFRSPYQPTGGHGGPDFYSRFSPTGLIGHPPPPPPTGHGGGHHHHHGGQGLSPQGGQNMGGHAAIVTPGPKQELGLGLGGQGDMNQRYRTQVDHKNNMNNELKNNQDANNDKKKPHIKKPLNAFMLYMKEMRAKVVAECTLKESAAINQILGRKWHSLSREEQAKYYEKARQERQLHMQLYPGWSARDNYGYGTKKKKRKKERVPVESGGNSMKKCRARYGLDQQSQWCKPCRRKKKCIRYMEAGGGGTDGNQSDDNLGSCGSMGDAHTPPEEDDNDHDHHANDDTEEDSMEHRSMSSPGALSALSSLTSPGGGIILPSPSTSVASPSVSVASPYVMQLQSPLTPHHHHDGLALPLPTTPFEALKLLPPPPIAPNYHHRLQHHLNSLHQVHNQSQQTSLSPHHPPNTTSPTTAPHPVAPTSPFLTATPVNNHHGNVIIAPQLHHQHHHQQQQQHVPVGTNPHDINNPLSVNQLTGQCTVKTEPAELNGAAANPGGGGTQQQRSIISVT